MENSSLSVCQQSKADISSKMFLGSSVKLKLIKYVEYIEKLA